MHLAPSHIDARVNKWKIPNVLLLAPNQFPPLPPGKAESLVGTGQVRSVPFDMTVFAVRTHAHTRGVWNRVQAEERNGTKFWEYRRGTQLPQSFIPLKRHQVLKAGQRLRFQCAYDTRNEKRPIHVGSTKHDEMCNVYLMYYKNEDTNSKQEWEIVQDGYANEDENQESQESQACSRAAFSSAVSTNKQIVGVAANEQHVYMFDRGAVIWDAGSFGRKDKYLKGPIKNDVVFEFSKNGELLRSFGANAFYLPHSVKLDPFDSNALWLVDGGSHTLREYKLDTLQESRFAGQHMTPGHGSSQFCKPTDVAFSADRTRLFVSDGYCNNRIVVLKRSDLQYSTEFQTNLNLPHALAITSCGSDEYLAIADRENGRVQVLNALTGFKLEHFAPWQGQGFLPYSLDFDRQSNRLVVGVVLRSGNKRQGALWTTNEAYCHHLAEKSPLEWTQTCSPSDALQEPHMISIVNGQILVAEAIDGLKKGSLMSVRLPPVI